MNGNTAPACADQNAYAATNGMDFFMGPNSYEGPSICAWFAPAKSDGNRPQLEPIDLCDLIDHVAHDDWVADLVSDAIRHASALGDVKIAAQNGKTPDEFFEKVALIENEARDSEIDLATTRKVIDQLLAEAQRLLKIDTAAVMEQYRQATERLMGKLNAPLPAEIQRELDELFQAKAKPSKPKDTRPAIYRHIDKALKDLPRHIEDDALYQVVFKLASKHGLDKNARRYAAGEIAQKTNLTRPDANKLIVEA